MRALSFLALLPALLGPGLACAEPLRAALPEYRVLSSSESESFEPALLQALAESLEETVEVADRSEDADLQLGPAEIGPIYYQAVPAALTASEGGVIDWSQLQGQPFCITAASPYTQLIVQRFDAQPREYPSAAHALIGLKLGECRAVVDDHRLLAEMAKLPEWRRYNTLLPALPDAEQLLRVGAESGALQARIDALIQAWEGEGRLDELVQFWIDEVAFQAYVLADTLDCH
ncbi:transporter substrate-binding domain-containing protein [Stutzerimonas nitrititolerans]|uniref:transporter substrate-binding domain-containing protein n=1 Tax=Stutzerimonas nitrititolerans TaxID=2482751 RepID=UPI002897946F|nr:transporter substrate-binding domain-containing protein [Stutzerimonas nitrititolerans]